MEVVKLTIAQRSASYLWSIRSTCLFRLDNATHESQALKVLSRASTHCVEIDFSGLDRSITLVLDEL